MQEPEILDEDFSAALKEMVGFVDISEQDLVEIYKMALEHARKRVRGHILVEQMMTREVLSVKTGTHPMRLRPCSSNIESAGFLWWMKVTVLLVS